MLLLHRMLELVFAAKLGFQQIQQARRVFADTLKALDPLSHAVLRINEIVNGAEPGQFRSNEHEEFENEVAAQIDAERFLQTLSETDQKILALRLKGRKMHPRGRVREGYGVNFPWLKSKRQYARRKETTNTAYIFSTSSFCRTSP